jgi:hypothetical protein
MRSRYARTLEREQKRREQQRLERWRLGRMTAGERRARRAFLGNLQQRRRRLGRKRTPAMSEHTQAH